MKPKKKRGRPMSSHNMQNRLYVIASPFLFSGKDIVAWGSVRTAASLTASFLFALSSAIASDTQAYKQAGNAVTVNVVHALGLRLKAAHTAIMEAAGAPDEQPYSRIWWLLLSSVRRGGLER